MPSILYSLQSPPSCSPSASPQFPQPRDGTADHGNQRWPQGEALGSERDSGDQCQSEMPPLTHNPGLSISLATAQSSNGQACDEQQEMRDMCLQLAKFDYRWVFCLIDGFKRPRPEADPTSQALQSRLQSRCQEYAELAANLGVSDQYCKSCKKDKLLDKFEFLPTGNKRKRTCQVCCEKKQTAYKRDVQKA